MNCASTKCTTFLFMRKKPVLQIIPVALWNSQLKQKRLRILKKIHCDMSPPTQFVVRRFPCSLFVSIGPLQYSTWTMASSLLCTLEIGIPFPYLGSSGEVAMHFVMDIEILSMKFFLIPFRFESFVKRVGIQILFKLEFLKIR